MKFDFPKPGNTILNPKMFDISLEAENWLQTKWHTSLVFCRAFRTRNTNEHVSFLA